MGIVPDCPIPGDASLRRSFWVCRLGLEVSHFLFFGGSTSLFFGSAQGQSGPPITLRLAWPSLGATFFSVLSLYLSGMRSLIFMSRPVRLSLFSMLSSWWVVFFQPLNFAMGGGPELLPDVFPRRSEGHRIRTCPNDRAHLNGGSSGSNHIGFPKGPNPATPR